MGEFSRAIFLYGTNQTSDVGGSLSFRKNKLGFNLFLNCYQSNGYDFSPEVFGETVSPFLNYTINPKLSYDFSEKLKLSVVGRYFTENQEDGFLVGKEKVSGNDNVQDWSLNPVLRYSINEKLKTTIRFYITQFPRVRAKDGTIMMLPLTSFRPLQERFY